MRIGISTPVVVAVPGVHSHWERSARIDDLSQIARKADELAFHHLTCSEHVAVPTAIAERRGGTYWDPLATLSYIAAHTTTIKLATLVLVLGYHHPLAIAKRYGTLDTISNGRLILGVGVGSLREEFMLVGAQFEGRGAIADESSAHCGPAWAKQGLAFQVSISTSTMFTLNPPRSKAMCRCGLAEALGDHYDGQSNSATAGCRLAGHSTNSNPCSKRSLSPTDLMWLYPPAKHSIRWARQSRLANSYVPFGKPERTSQAHR